MDKISMMICWYYGKHAKRIDGKCSNCGCPIDENGKPLPITEEKK